MEASLKSHASAILVLTTACRSAHLISKYRPRCPIIAITRNAKIARQCHLYRGILPYVFEEPKADDWSKDLDARINAGVLFGKDTLKFLKSGDTIIVVTGWKQGSGSTNTMRIIQVE